MAVTTPFKVKCDHCELTIVVADPGFIGKKISCRRCKYRFRIEAPTERFAEHPASAEVVSRPFAAAKPNGTGPIPFQVKCACCELAFSVNDPTFIGKKISCRRCKYQFRIEAPSVGGAANVPAPSSIPLPATSSAESKPSETGTIPEAIKPPETVRISGEVKLPEEAKIPEEIKLPEEAKREEVSAIVLKKNKKKRKLKRNSRVTRIGLALGLLGIGLIVGGYFAFFDNGGQPNSAKNQGKSIAKTDTNHAHSDASKTQKSIPPKEVATVESKQPKAGDAAVPKAVDPKEPKQVDPLPPVKPILLPDGRHITNLLPEDSQWVLSMSKEVMKTPIAGVLFEPTGSGKTFEKWMGFAGDGVDGLVVSGGLESAWIFAVVRLKNDIAIPELQQAMELGSKQTILKRDYYVIRSNDWLKLAGDVLASEIAAHGLVIPPVDASETMTLHLLDSHTLIFAHLSAMEKFLAADTKRQEQTRYIAPNAEGNRPNPKTPQPTPSKPTTVEAKSQPLKGKTEPTAPKPKEVSGQPVSPIDDTASPRGLTSNPTYLSVDPVLKIVLNQLEQDRRPMLTFAVKLDGLGRLGAGVANALVRSVVKLPADGIPQAPTFGMIVTAFSSKKLSLEAAVQLDTPGQTKFWVEVLKFQSPRIANFLTDLFGVRVRIANAAGKEAPAKSTPFESMFEVKTHERTISTALDVDWRAVYDPEVGPNLRFQVDLFKGRALMQTGRAHWARNAQVIKRLEKSGEDIPQGAFPRKTNDTRFDLPYPPQQRVGWMVDMLPYLGYDSMYHRINKELAWNDEANLRPGRAWIPEFLSPAFPTSASEARVPSMRGVSFGATHFVGLSGLGLEAAEYPSTPEYAKQLGVFGYERRASFKDIEAGDGTSNTIFMIETPPNIPRPWIRGGGATVQGVHLQNSVRPFVSRQPSGRQGTIALMADGSVRFIGANVSDPVFQALVTYQGGEQIGEIESIAPLFNPSETEVKPIPPPLVNFPRNGAEWVAVEIPEIGGTVRMPSQPARAGDGGQTIYIWPKQRIVAPLLTLSAAAPAVKPFQKDGTNTDLDRLLEAMENKGLKPEKCEYLTMLGRPARRYEVSTSRGVLHQQMFIADFKVVIMEVAKNGKATPEDVKKYFDSAALTQPAATPVEPKAEGPKIEPKPEVLPVEPREVTPKPPTK